MSPWELLGAFMLGAAKGVAIVFVFAIIVMSLMRGCVELARAQSIDVRIDERDRSISGMDYPGDYDPMIDARHSEIISAIEGADTDAVTAIENLTLSLWDPTTYISCLNYNESVYLLAEKAGDTELELSPQFEVLLKPCWKMVP